MATPKKTIQWFADGAPAPALPTSDTRYYVARSSDPTIDDWSVQLRISRVPFLFPDQAPDELRVNLVFHRFGRYRSLRFDALRLQYKNAESDQRIDFSTSVGLVQRLLMEYINLPGDALVKRSTSQAYAKACIDLVETGAYTVNEEDTSYWFR